MKKLLFAVLLVLSTVTSYAQNIEKGYHGFADVGYCAYISQIDPSTIEVTTSHGYQFNPYLFLGAGVGFDFTGETKWGDVSGHPYNKRDSKVDIPVFFNARANFTKTRFIPFVDAKVGAYVTEGNGIYANAAIGCRYSFGNNMGISLSVGCEARKVTVKQLNMTTGNKYNNYNYSFYYTDRENEPVDGVVIKMGFDF